MDTVEEHFYLMNQRPEVESMDMVEEHLDMVDTSMGEDRAAELEVVEREPKGVVLVRHWIGNGAVRHR
jgi:hypothetical protein